MKPLFRKKARSILRGLWGVTDATTKTPVAPSWVVDPAIAGTAEDGSLLTCSAYASGYPAPALTYVWTRNAAQVGTGATWLATQGTAVLCTVIAANTSGTISKASALFGPIAQAPAAPVWTVAPAISGNAVAGEVLTCSAGTVTGYPVPTPSYTWERSGSTVGTGPTWTATQGAAVTCVATATNSQGTATSTSAPFGPIAAADSLPIVTNASQSAGTLTITGSNFGAGKVTPLLWDTFESGSNGATIAASPQAGSWDAATGPAPLAASTYSTAQAHSGSKSLYSPRTAGEYGNFAVALPDSPRFCQGFWFRYNRPAGIGQVRLAEVWGTYRVGDYNPGVMIGSDGGAWSGHVALENTGTTHSATFTGPSQDDWHQYEAILQQSDVGVANGRVTVRIDGATVYDKRDIITRERPGERWERAHFLSAMTGFLDDSAQTWIDEAYINDSWSRVELGNASTYAACTQTAIQPLASWADGSITATLNPGAFSGTVYAYVTTADGAVNANGVAVSLNTDVAPVWTVTPTISGGTTAGSTLTVSGGTVTGSPTPELTYAWSRGGSSGATWVATEGVAVTCTVTATNSAGQQSVTTAAFGPITTQSGSAVAYRDISATTYASRTNTVVPVPSGIQDGDFMILMLVVAGFEPVTPTEPAGWTLFSGFPQRVEQAGGAFKADSRVYWRRAANEPASYTFTHASGSTDAVIVAASGVVADAVPTITLAYGTATEGTAGGTATIDGPSVAANTWVGYLMHNWSLHGSTPVPSGFVERLDSAANLIYVADTIVATASPIGRVAHDNSNPTAEPWLAVLVTADGT